MAELTSLGVSAAGIAADLAEPESARKVFEETQAKLGPVDILVNNVGGRKGTTIVDTTDEQLAGGFNMNLRCALRFMKFVIPGMKERKWGRIINITSIHGREYGGSVDYMAAKAALIATTKFAALELIKDNVLVNSVAPGSILHPGGS